MMTAKSRLLEAVKRIPEGKVSTYGAIAEVVRTSPRTVGAVMKANRNPSVPCHRIIGNDGSLIGFNRGLKKKVRLLRKEGVKVRNGKVDLKNCYFSDCLWRKSNRRRTPKPVAP